MIPSRDLTDMTLVNEDTSGDLTGVTLMISKEDLTDVTLVSEDAF